MKNLLKNNLIKNYLIFLIFTNMLEIVFRLITNIEVFDISILRIFIGLNFISLLLSFIISWLNKTVAKIAIILICFGLSFYAFFQIGFNNFIGVYASINSSSQLGAVTEYIKDFFSSFLPKYYLTFIPEIILILYYLFLDKKTQIKIDKRFPLKSNIRFEPGIRTISTTLVLALVAFIYNETLTMPFMQNELQTVSNKSLFAYPSVPSIAINQFGVLGFGILDIKSYNTEEPEIFEYMAEGNSSKTDSEREIDDTIWQNIIDDEKNKKLNSINKYLINSNIPGYNDHTGIFEGKNLIVIMLESVNDIIINPKLYPNFYKLYSEGISFKNNYSPRNSCSTGNNEFSGITGIYSIQNNCTANVYKNNTYFTSLFNLFNDAGYKTSSMHDYTEAYYFRNTIHPNLGSGRYYDVQDLGIKYYGEYKNWASDEDFMKVAMDITLEDTRKPFMLWLTTVSSHQPYGIDSVEGIKYYDITEGTDYPKDLRRYMSKLKTVDNALGILLDRLKDAGILDDTVIAMYGDHYPYGLKNETISYALDYDLEDHERERVPMVIYNSKIKPEIVTRYSSFVNLTPTLANMFNLPYDPRYYMGVDVFNEDYLDVIAFSDGSWKNDIAYYDAQTASIKYYTDKTYTTKEIKNINNIVSLKVKMSSAIIKNNYFSYLENKIKEYKEVENDNNTLANIGG